MTPVYTPTLGRDAGHEDYAAPVLILHVGDGIFGQDEGGAEVDLDRVVEFRNGDVDDVGDALAVAGVGD